MRDPVCRKAIRGFTMALALLLGHPSAPAQSVQYGKLTGEVTFETGEPLPDVNIQIASAALISRTRSTSTTSNGMYVFINLPVGTYQLTATRAGLKTVIRENIMISAGAVMSVDVGMMLGEVAESVIVTAAGPVVDSETSTVSTKFDEPMLRRLPTSRDAFYDLALMAPGTTGSAKVSSWLPGPSAYGGSANEDSFLVNGINLTDPRGGAFGSLVNVNYDSVQEVHVLALGSKAEFGSATGLTVDVLTKSGGNQFSGNLSYYVQPLKPADNVPGAGENLGRDWLYLEPGSRPDDRTIKDSELTATLGGPIIKDKVWFYTAYDHINEDRKVSLWPLPLQRTNRYYDFKITAQPTPNGHAWVACHIERNRLEHDTWGYDLPWDTSLNYGATQNNNTISSEWQWVQNDRNMVSAKYLGYWTDSNPLLPADAPSNPGYLNFWKWRVFAVNGHFPYNQARDSTRHTIQADFSHYAENFLGEQDIKFGVQYTAGHGNQTGDYFAGYGNFAYPLRYNQDISYCKNAYGDTGMQWYVDQRYLPPFKTVRRYRQAGVFCDDQWTLSKRLTLNLGLRYDNMTCGYGKGEVYEMPASPHDTPASLSVIRDRQGTGNIFDFNTLSPRLGATYLPTDDRKTALRANIGRYYMPIGLDNLGHYGPDMPLMRTHRLYFNVPWELVDTNHNNYVDPDEVTAAARLLKDFKPYDGTWLDPTDLSWQCKVAAGTKPEFTDLITFNVEREIMKDLSLSATIIHKRTGNTLANWPINRQTGKPFEYERVTYTTKYGQTVDLYSILMKDYNADGRVDDQDVNWIRTNRDYEVRNLPQNIDGIDPEQTYKGLQLAVKKRYSDRWQMLLSFLYSASNGVANRNRHQDWYVTGSMVMDERWIESPNQLIDNIQGPLPFTPKYQFKISGSYQIPKAEIGVGWRFSYDSGRPVWWLEDVPPVLRWPDPSGVVVDTVPWLVIVAVDPKNPRYLPATKTLDLHLDRIFDLGRYNTLRLSLDCFNALNAKTITNVDPYQHPGQVTGVLNPSRRLRVGISYEF